MKKLFYIIPLMLFTISCTIKPEPIHYGEDNCILCQMTIMDHRYGTEMVTSKGKIFKFDSIECMVDYFKETSKKGEEYRYILFTPFDQPGKLTDALTGYVLHSKNLPSPMGMYLTAFEDKAAAMRFQQEKGGRIYDWNGLVEFFEVMKREMR
ncbi:MAG TPA: nitrous oxide reductase accessory protein NosL [Bacteroidales bacterium]|nr:nitrous oxide reductase accessory protein NosL [Bacteroidales bacterium]